MKSVYFFAMIICLSCLSFIRLQAQTQTIKGTVLDKDTRQPLIGAVVKVVTTEPVKGANTNEKGEFVIRDVPVGRHAVSCTYFGYSTYRSDNLILNSVKELIINIELTETGTTIEGATLLARQDNPHEAQNPFNPVSMRSFSVEETQRYPGSVNDPSRMAMGFAGVQAPQDNNSDIVIRGNSPVGLLWRLEGIDIPNPNHFARKGSSGGGITVFSAQLLGNSDFSTGAFSAEYGNAFSGVFDMKFRHGNTENREYRFKFGLLGIDLATEGYFKQGQSSYLVNYRYSTLGILNDLGFRLVGERIDNNFQDLSFNLYFPSKDQNTTLTVFGIGGLSSELWDPVKDSLTWSTPYRTTRDFITNMGATGLTLTHLLDTRSYIKAVVAVSGNQVTDNDDTLDIRTVMPAASSSMLHAPVDFTTLPESRYETEDYKNIRISSHVFYNRKFNPAVTLKTGMLATHMRFAFDHQQIDPTNSEFNTLVEGSGNSNLLQAYAQMRFNPTENLTINAGLHSLFLTLNNTYSIEPRLSLKYKLPKNQSLSLAYGLHGQAIPLGSYFTKTVGIDGAITQPNLNLELVKAHHSVIGYEKLFEGNLRLSIEGYYQRLFNVPVSATPSDYWVLNERDGYADQALTNEGTGTNKGIDVTFEKFFSTGVFFLVSGSLYESNYQASDGKTYSTRYNSRYNTSAMGGGEIALSKGGIIQLGARTVYNGGLKYTPGDEALSKEAGEFVPQEGAAFSENVGKYFRIDLRAAYRKSLPKVAYILSLDIQNATNRKNVRDQIYDPGYNQLTNRFQSGLVPVLSFQIDF